MKNQRLEGKVRNYDPQRRTLRIKVCFDIYYWFWQELDLYDWVLTNETSLEYGKSAVFDYQLYVAGGVQGQPLTSIRTGTYYVRAKAWYWNPDTQSWYFCSRTKWFNFTVVP